jgi:DNA-directed DNA polymerase III PolC
MPVALHTHSWYSLLEGASSPETLLARAAATGYTALTLTDTNNLYGAVSFIEHAFRHGVRPLLGACLRQHRSRCVALIADPTGYRHLCRVLSRLHLSSSQAPSASAGTVPSLALRACRTLSSSQAPSASAGTVPSLALQACRTSTVPASPLSLAELLCANAEGLHVLVDDVVLAERLREAFGVRLWLEIVRPRAASGAGRHERELLACGQRLGLRAVASTAVHFATPADYPTFRALTAVRQNTLLDQLPRTLPITPDHHLPTPEEMRRRFHDLPEAVRHGDELAELLRSDVLPRELVLPEPRLSRQLNLTRYLHHLCERGLRARCLGTHLGARQRLREELAILEAANLTGYFLTVRDIARHARRRGHSIALRGSAGNSLVCYLLGITDVDPLRFGLSLERFLHPGRIDLPDIDLDFDWKVRDEVIAHMVQRHGAAHTARISSHLFFQPRSAFREAAKFHGLANEQVSQLLTTLADRVDDLLLPAELETAGGLAREDAGAPAAFPLEAERWPRILADARRLLGRPHHLSIHPGGIVMTPGPIEEHVPLQMAAKGVVITQFEKDAVEQIGLVKIDLLGNRALATVDEARRHAGVRAAPCPAENDPATVALLRRGDTLGVNQLESPAMRHLLIQMRPQGIDDVIQALALVRPGASGVGAKECFIRRRHGLEPYRVTHPRLAALLGETHGLLLYEDDTLRLMQDLAGLSAADADRFRKRLVKQQSDEESGRLETEFRTLCARRGVPADAVDELWPQLSKFNRYSFCKSHAVSYGLIAWQAASLKAHHPVAFWTAALNNNQGAYPRRVYVEAIKRAGISLHLPCVNRSADAFTPEGDSIRIGLEAIAGLPVEVRESLLRERAQHGLFRDLADLRRRVPMGPEALALLIRSGACDVLGPSRPALFLEAELQDRRKTDTGELFPDHVTGDWSPADYGERERLRAEWELFGFVLGPPLFALFRPDESSGASPQMPLVCSRELPEYHGRSVRVQGLVATTRHVFTTDGRPMQFITLEDEDGFAEVTLFPGTCPQVPYLTIGPYVATGVVEEQYGVFTLTARRFQRWEPGAGLLR